MEELKEQVETTFSLPNETITVKFIPRKKGMASNVPDNHIIAGGMMSRAKHRISAPLQANGKIANLLTTEEKDYLEEKTGLNLSVYGDFWKTYYVSLFKDDASNKLYLGDELDYISYKILSAAPEIAPDWESRNLDQEYKFAITREGEVKDEKKKALDVKFEAIKYYGKIEDNREKLISVLKLLSNRAIAPNTKLKWLQGEVQSFLDEKPKAFLEIVSDPHFETKALINRAIEAKVIIKENNQYRTVDGLELCEKGEIPTYGNAVRYLEDEKNQELKLTIEARTDKA